MSHRRVIQESFPFSYDGEDPNGRRSLKSSRRDSVDCSRGRGTEDVSFGWRARDGVMIGGTTKGLFGSRKSIHFVGKRKGTL